MWRIAWQRTTGPAVLVTATTTAYWVTTSGTTESNSSARQPCGHDKTTTTTDLKAPSLFLLPPPSPLFDRLTSTLHAVGKSVSLSREVVAVTQCEAAPPAQPSRGVVVDENGNNNNDSLDPSVAPTVDDLKNDDDEDENVIHVNQGFQPSAKGDFHGLFPARQLWHPAVEYPLWYVDHQ
jgi:hypothetical protein